jgi:hypothetical protein
MRCPNDREKKIYKEELEALERASLRVGDSVRSGNPKKQVTLRLDFRWGGALSQVRSRLAEAH